MSNYKSLDNRLKKLEAMMDLSDFDSVIFQINGQEEDGEENETMVMVKDEWMSLEDFNAKYPKFKPTGISIVLGEWKD